MSDWTNIEDKLPPDDFALYFVALRDQRDNYEHLNVLRYEGNGVWNYHVEEDDERIQHSTVTHWKEWPPIKSPHKELT